MTERMDDEQVQARIELLEQEEAGLRRDESDAADVAGADRIDEDARRLAAIRLELDQLWDYLRQRRALRSAGEDPDGAELRDSDTVEGYQG